jgi:hypothetical protein
MFSVGPKLIAPVVLDSMVFVTFKSSWTCT